MFVTSALGSYLSIVDLIAFSNLEEVRLLKFSNKRIFNLSKNIKIKNLNVYGESKNIFQKIISNINRIIKLRIEIKKNQSNVIISFLTTTNILTLISSIGLGKKIIINERNDPTKQKIHYFWKFLHKLPGIVIDGAASADAH